MNQASTTSKRNPFKLPEFKSIFDIRDANERVRKKETARMRQLKLIQKQNQGRQVESRRTVLADDEDSVADQEEDDIKIILNSTKGKHVENETYQEYVTNQRKMFLAEYSIAVQKNEIRRLENLAQLEEKKLELAEKCLEQDAALFDEFLRENDKSSVEAIAAAEQESRKRAALSDDIKQLTGQQLKISAEINRLKEILIDYKSYRDFLERLIPDQARLVREAARKERQKAKCFTEEMEQKRIDSAKLHATKLTTDVGTRRSSILVRRRSSVKPVPTMRLNIGEVKTPQSLDQDSSESEDEQETVFFKSPEEVLEILSSLEEANLRLIQHCQETQENIDVMKNVSSITREKLEMDHSHLVEFQRSLKEEIQEQANKTEQLSVNVSDFEFAGMGKGDQEALLKLCREQIAASYKACMHKGDVSMSSVQMLNDLEERLIRLIQLLLTLPDDQVKSMLQAKEVEHRLQVKEQKKEEQRLHQEERVRRALERAKSEPKKATGRRVMTRSEPIKKEKADKRDQEALLREEEEMMFLFG